MPEFARVLRFPDRKVRVGLSPGEARLAARQLLESSRGCLDNGDQYVFDPDVLLNVLEELRENGNFSPSTAALNAERIYSLIDSCPDRVGVFDEKDYFLGSAALIAGGANRLLGRRDTAEIWLDRAEAAFRHTVNPGPSLAAVTYARLAVLYDARSYLRVLEQTPSLLTSFARFGMKREHLKTRFLESLTLKEIGRTDQALTNILLLASDPDLTMNPELAPVVSVHAAELLSEQGRYAEAEQYCERALRSESANQPLVMGHLKGISGVALREQGRLGEAAESFRAAILDYASAEMKTQVAYMRVVLAETLLLLSRYREAEWEILAALPTIEEQKMVPEGFAAVALLKESVRRRKTDPNALRELREHLQANR